MLMANINVHKYVHVKKHWIHPCKHINNTKLRHYRANKRGN